MARRTTKRRRAGKVANVPTKRNRRDALASQCSSVAAALQGGPGLTKKLRSMLVGLVPLSLGVSKDKRHPLQRRAVQMIEDALAGMEALLESEVEEARVSIDRAPQDEVERAATLQEANANLMELSAEVAEARAAVNSGAEAVRTARAAVVTASASQEEGDAFVIQALSKKAHLEGVHQQILVRVKERGRATDADMEILSSVGKDFGFDAALMSSMESALEQEPGVQSASDVVIIDRLAAEFASAIASLNTSILEEEPKQAERAAAMALAEASLAAAVDAHADSKKKFFGAMARERSGEGMLKAATSAVSCYTEDTKKRMDAFDEAQGRLKDFLCGPLAAFEALKELAPVARDIPALRGQRQLRRGLGEGMPQTEILM